MIHFHFNLSHLKNQEDLHVSMNGKIIPLIKHTESSQKKAGQKHGALQYLNDSVREKFSHYVKYTKSDLKTDVINWVKVIRKTPADVHLDKVLLMTQHIPEGYVRAYYREEFKRFRENLGKKKSVTIPGLNKFSNVHSARLYEFGIKQLPDNDDEAIDLLIHSQTLVTARDTAACLVAHNPNLFNTQPYTAIRVMEKHINPNRLLNPHQSNAIQELSNEISAQGEDWSPVIECRAPNGDLMKAEYDLPSAEEKALLSEEEKLEPGFTIGQQLYTFGLAEDVEALLGGPVNGAQNTAANDMDLIEKIWAPTSGTSALVTNSEEQPIPDDNILRSSGANVEYKWTVNEKTSHYGVSASSSSITIDDDDEFSIDCSNSYSRTLYAGYRLKDENGIFGEVKTLNCINATNDIMGFPVSTLPTKLAFNMKKSSEIQLVLGSLGTSDWDDDVSPQGALYTGLLQYGIPGILVVAGKLLSSTKVFRQILEDKELMKRIMTVFVSIKAVEGIVEYGDNKNFGTLASLADMALSIVLKKSLEKLGSWVLMQVGTGALTSAMGPVGWIMRAAAVSVSLVRVGVTTGQVLSSPATVRINVTRAIDVALILKPDPEHGEIGNPASAVWPSVATRYLVTLQYLNGTNLQLSGPLEKVTSNKPISLVFKDVPAGGKFQVLAGVYSDNGWLAGVWQSESLESIPNEGHTFNLGEHTIEECLVPLSPDTQYYYKEEIEYTDDSYRWTIGEPSTTTVHALDGGNQGSLAELINISINNGAYQVGYAWRASGQNLHPDENSNPKSNEQLYSVQSLSLLTTPGSRLIKTDIGFTQRPQIAYSPSTTRGDEIDQRNFVLDPRNGELNLRQVELMNNEPEDGKLDLRHLKSMKNESNEGRDFGFGDDEQMSWGRFPMLSIDAFAIHPSNTVIACSFEASRMMILNLPEQSSKDKDAPMALLASGKGIREGLMNGPKAMAIAPDGSILILESVNKRVQAFDIKGNPVPSFTRDTLFQLNTTDVQTDLDQEIMPEAFYQGLIEAATTERCTLSETLIPELDQGQLSPDDAVIQALSEQGVILSYTPEEMNDSTESAILTVDETGSQWSITDPRGYLYRLVKNEDGNVGVYQLPLMPKIEVQTIGKQWLVVDRGMGMAWKLTPSFANEGHTLVKPSFSFFALDEPEGVTYLDMTVEAEGHVYILYYTKDGSKTTNYCLNIYSPDGKLLIHSPNSSINDSPENIVAGKIDVDIWRSIYALSYAPMSGLDTVQPGLMHWNPTTPIFDLPLSVQPDLNDKNVTAIIQEFGKHGYTLTNPSITVNDPEGSWTVKDNGITYHIYRCGDSLEVYLIKA